MSPYNYAFNNPTVWNDLSGADPGDKEEQVKMDGVKGFSAFSLVPSVDNNAVAPSIQTYNLFTAPDGGILQLPINASVESTFGGSAASSGGVSIHPLEGSVWLFSYKNEEYAAQFNGEGTFTGYQSTTNKDHKLAAGVNTTPKVDPNEGRNSQIKMAGAIAGTPATNLNPVVKVGAAAVAASIAAYALTKGPTMDLPISLSAPRPIDWDKVRGKPVAIPLDATTTKPNEDNGTVIYRSMKMDDMGTPIVEESARGLGVRPNSDIPVIEGFVTTLTGGMSVAPNDPNNLPLHRRPVNLGGTGKDPVFEMNTKDLPYGLYYDQDKPGHGTIQPAFPMPYEAYKTLLSSTKLLWKSYGK